MIESMTRAAVDALYSAYFAGDAAAMAETMSDDVEMRFLGRSAQHGRDEALQFLTSNTAKLVDLDFRIRGIIIDGEWAATLWEETATTIDGEPYANHGVDVFRVVDGEVAVLHENNDIVVHRSHIGEIDHPGRDAAGSTAGR